MRVGSVVEFVVYNISMDDTEVLASRVSAMQILSYDAYLGKNKMIEPGKKVKGNITYIMEFWLTVSAQNSSLDITNCHGDTLKTLWISPNSKSGVLLS